MTEVKNTTEQAEGKFNLEDNLYNGTAIMNEADEQELATISGAIETFLAENKLEDYNKLPYEKKEELYAYLTGNWSNFTTKLRSTQFNLPLSLAEFEFLRLKITKEIEYSKDTLPFALVIAEEYFKKYHSSDFKKAEQTLTNITIDNLVKMIHLMDKVTVKGCNTAAATTYYFILRKFGEIHKVFNKYDMMSQNLSNSIQKFVSGIVDTVEPSPEGPTQEGPTEEGLTQEEKLASA